MFDLSVVVCTYNRCESLRDTLRALKQQELPEEIRLEILVVDNNSKDRTRQVVEEEARESRWPIRYVFERAQGLNYARNRGTKESQGEFVAFTDDDIIPDPQCARELWETANAYQADCVGGKILPLWLEEAPPWMEWNRIKHHFAGALALLDRGPDVIVADKPDSNFLYGGNIVYRRSVLEETGSFRTDLGPRGLLPLRGDDTEMLARVFKAGKKVVYAPRAIVRHKVPPQRMRMAYFRRWKFFAGYSTVKMELSRKRVPVWFIKECLMDGVGALLCYVRRNNPLAMEKEILFWERLGRIAGAWTT